MYSHAGIESRVQVGAFAGAQASGLQAFATGKTSARKDSTSTLAQGSYVPCGRLSRRNAIPHQDQRF